MEERQALRRPSNGRVIGGVMAGLARFFGVDATALRALAAALALLYGTGIVAYLIAWVIIPSE